MEKPGAEAPRMKIFCKTCKTGTMGLHNIRPDTIAHVFPSNFKMRQYKNQMKLKQKTQAAVSQTAACALLLNIPGYAVFILPGLRFLSRQLFNGDGFARSKEIIADSVYIVPAGSPADRSKCQTPVTSTEELPTSVSG